jgi:hypothetical protein
MKKQAIAVAVGALFAAPAAYGQIVFGNEKVGTVQIYGKLYPQAQWARSEDPTQPGQTLSTLVPAITSPVTTPGAHNAVQTPRDVARAKTRWLETRWKRTGGFPGARPPLPAPRRSVRPG